MNKSCKNVTKQQCINVLKTLAEKTDKNITRDYFRLNTRLSDHCWERHFGTFLEFRRAAGLIPSKHVTRMGMHVAKHEAVSKYKELTLEKQDFSDKYLKPSGRRFETIMVGSDIHDIECDPFWRKLFIETIKRVQPAKVILNGDLFDLPEFGKFNVDPRGWDVVGRIKWVHKFLEDIREAHADTEISLIEGNHECVSLDTEVLTTKGWKKAKYINYLDNIAQMNLKTKQIVYSPALALNRSKQTMVTLKGNMHNEKVSINHHVILDGKRTKVRDLVDTKIKQTRFCYAAGDCKTEIDLSDDEIKLLTWVITDGCMYKRQIKNIRLQWKLSKQRKIDALEKLLTKMGIKYTKKKATLCKFNKLQPYMIRVYSDAAREVYAKLAGVKTYPVNWVNMSHRQSLVFLNVLEQTDGGKHFNHSIFSTAKLEEAELIQLIFITSGIPCKIKKIVNSSGYKTNAVCYRLSIYSKGLFGNVVKVEELPNKEEVVAIQTQQQTIVTRREGRVVITGNCRMLRHLAEATPAMKAILSDLHGFTVPKLLGLDKYQVNYIAPADLAVFTQADMKAQLRKNYLVIHDCLLAHHFPEGKSFGLAGWNGHHHSHLVDTLYNPLVGSYEWHQLGSGHKREACYTNGQKWGNGFLLAHVDVREKRTQFEYIDTTSDHVVIGGKWYQR